MSKRSKRLAKKIIEALKEPAPLNNNPGPLLTTSMDWASEKDRRNDGWSTPKIVKPRMKYSKIIEEALEPQKEYDDWDTREDGLSYGRFEKDKLMYPDKVKKQIQIRRARKMKDGEII